MLAGVLLAGCSGKGGDSGTADERPAVIASLAEHMAATRYAEFEARAETLASASAVICAAPTEEALTSAREAWWSAREPWKRAEIVQFGPVVEYPDRLGPKIDDWPVNADAVEELVAGEGALDQDAFDAMGSATRGLPVVEYLLWERGDPTLDALTASGRRCEVLAGAAADVSANAARLEEVWRTDWQARVSSPEGKTDDDYDTVQDVLAEWVNRMGFTVENIRSTKLGAPLGDSSGGEPQPDAIESRYSGRSLTDARDALAGVRDAWTGDVGGDHTGIVDLVDDAGLVTSTDALFDEAEGRLAEVPETLEETVTLQPEIAARAQEALQALQVAIQVDLAQALGVTVAFNDNDGD